MLGPKLADSLPDGSDEFSFWAGTPRADWLEVDRVLELCESPFTAGGIVVAGFSCVGRSLARSLIYMIVRRLDCILVGVSRPK